MLKKKENLFSLSEGHNPNYVATICKIEELHNIEGADNLCKTIINGYDIIVNKTYKVGDIVVFLPSETVIDSNFLSKNNLYSPSDRKLNSNYESVQLMLTYAEIERDNNNIELSQQYESAAKSLCGFFTKSGRVKSIKLRGYISNGFIISTQMLDNFLDVKYDWNNVIGQKFDTINGKLFCWKYIPPIKEITLPSNKTRWEKILNKTARRIKRIIPGQFEFHYTTKKINENMFYFKPDDIISITTKIHGSAGIFSNVLCNTKMNWFKKLLNKIGFSFKEKEYGNLFASRTSIKNEDLNPNARGYYDINVWDDVNEAIKEHIPNGMTVYGEIVGYLPGTKIMIQKGYDYGCDVGEWKFMPYRITETDENNNKIEWEVDKVNEWTKSLKDKDFYISKHLMLMDILYIGKFKDLYPELDVNSHWNQNVLSKMKNEKMFLMEEPEPLCNLGWDEYHKIKIRYKDISPDDKDYTKIQRKIENTKNKIPPREGIVIRKIGDKTPTAFKLKTNLFSLMETKQHDDGNVSIEEME